MNDFTKEELEFIALSIDSITLEDNETELHNNLFHKIQSMIDNYCEHEWVVETKEFDIKNAKCRKCGVNK